MRSATRHRPIGIAVLAILAVVFGILLVLVGMLFIASDGSAGDSIASLFGPDIAGALTIAGFCALLFGLLYLLFAFGAWRLRSWAWRLGVVGSIAFVFGGFVSYSNTTPSAGSASGSVVFVAIALLILLDLLTPGVRRAFGR